MGEPPPQEVTASIAPSITGKTHATRTNRRLRDGPPRKTIPRSPLPVKAASVIPLNGWADDTVRTVVLRVSVVLIALPLGVKVGGLKEQADAAGRPVQAKLTVPVKPPCGVMEIVKGADCPAAIVVLALGTLME